MVGDVSKILRHEVELVRMQLLNPWVDRRPIKDKGKTVNMEINDGIAANSSSLMHLEDWDLVDNNIFLAKLQQAIVDSVYSRPKIEDLMLWREEFPYVAPQLELKSYDGVLCVN